MASCDSDSGNATTPGAGAGSDAGLGASAAEPSAADFRPLPGDGVDTQTGAPGTDERVDPRDPNYVDFDQFVDSTDELRRQISGAGGTASYRIGSAFQADSGTATAGTSNSEGDAGFPVEPQVSDAGPDSSTP